MPPVPPIPVNYSNLGDVRFGRFFWVIALFLISSHAHVRAAQSVRLAWNASPSSGVTGYRVYYRTSSGRQSISVNVGNVLTATISVSMMRTTYVFWVTAYNSAGLESSRSNEVSYTTPSSPRKRIILQWIMAPVTVRIPGARKIHDRLIRHNRVRNLNVWEGDDRDS